MYDDLRAEPCLPNGSQNRCVGASGQGRSEFPPAHFRVPPVRDRHVWGDRSGPGRAEEVAQIAGISVTFRPIPLRSWRTMDGFALTKWYIDCVDGHGRSAMVYSSALAWGRATVSWHSLSIHQPGIDPTHDSSVARLALPGREGSHLCWRAEPLGCTVRCRPVLAPFSRRLLERADGFVDWQCEASAATVEIELAG